MKFYTKLRPPEHIFKARIVGSRDLIFFSSEIYLAIHVLMIMSYIHNKHWRLLTNKSKHCLTITVVVFP